MKRMCDTYMNKVHAKNAAAAAKNEKIADICKLLAVVVACIAAGHNFM